MKRTTMRVITVLLLLSMVLPFCIVPATAATEGTATLVTDASSLKVGDKIIIVAADYDKALSTEARTNNRGQTGITKSGNTVTFDETTQMIELVEGAVEGTFGFSIESGYMYAASSKSNHLKISTSLNENGSWKISIADGVATMLAQGSNTINRIFYNTTSAVFSCYAPDNTTQKAVSIYLVVSVEEKEDEGGGNTDEDIELEEGDTNVLIKSASQLKVGDKIIIAAMDVDCAIGTTQNTGNRSQAVITRYRDDTISYGTDVQVITLEAGLVDGTFAFNVGTGYLHAASSASNHLKTYSNLSENGSWKITVDSTTGVATIAAQGSFTRNYIRYNGSATLFSCYGPTNQQGDVCIYLVRNEGGDVGEEEEEEMSTGYTSAADVVYNTYEGIIANWGARDELATFLSTYATEYYQGDYSYETMSQISGGTSASTAPTSALYEALQAMMVAEHHTFTKYSSSSSMDCRNFYQYTDSYLGDPTYVSTLYLGNKVKGTWNGGAGYNQEHVWPKSKCIGTDDTDIGDIMHLRAANPNENSSRGNSAYGLSEGYYTPNARVRGDCARMLLYMYVRWGNTNLWGTSGAIESLDILLDWMEADPVDTWEMGRNDSVQSITGVRNVFVDYPEYAWLLFGEEIPENMSTPAGEKSEEKPDEKCESCVSFDKKVTYPTLDANGYTTFTCTVCGDSYVENYTFPDVPNTLWSYNAIEFAVAKGFFTGYTSGNFGPTDNITRQDFVIVLARIAGVDLNQYSGRTGFPDVKAGDYYEKAVKWASSNGIVNGYQNGNFGVGDKITREQMVTILYNYAKKMGYDTSVPADAAAKLNAYADAHKITGYARPAVIWALNKGVISGMNATTIGPQEYASRGQTATILMNISKKGIMPI